MWGAVVCRAAGYGNPQLGMAMEASTDTEGEQVNTSPEKQGMLRCEYFPTNDDDLCF